MNNLTDIVYLNLLADIMKNGKDHAEDRTGVGRRRVFGRQLRFSMRDNHFPLITTKSVSLKSAIAETLCFIRGETNIETLEKEGCKFWGPWAASVESVKRYTAKLVQKGFINLTDVKTIMDTVPDEIIGEIGPMYGANWRYWPRRSEHTRKEAVIREVKDMPSDFVKTLTAAYESLDEGIDKTKFSLEMWLQGHYYSHVDQLGELIFNLKNDPYGSRHLMTAYDPDMNPIPGFTPDENVIAEKGCLMPCHYAWQVFVQKPEQEGGKPLISLMFQMRSWDVFLGGPYNIAGYALILKMLAHCLDYEPDELICTAGDAHIYFNQFDQVEEQLSRAPKEGPKLYLNPDKKDFFDFQPDDFRLEGYDPHPAIAATPAV